jgi:hypothetical protein
MRSLAFVLLAACATNPPASSPTATTVREQLVDLTKLLISGDGSVGSLVAQHNTSSGWVGGSADMTIANGELIANVVGDQLVAQTFDVAVDPIDLPESVFGMPARLTDVRVTLASSANATITWTDDNHATATLPLALDLSWSIEINGGVTELGAPHLPTIPLDVSLTGSDVGIDAALGLHAAGTLWTWADLVELSKLDLSLAATAAFE